VRGRDYKEGQKQMVGTGRFELPTPRTPSECSTRLSHVPTDRNPLPSAAADGVDSSILHEADVISLRPQCLSSAKMTAEIFVGRVESPDAIATILFHCC
jgi:hypothetical protein